MIKINVTENNVLAFSLHETITEGYTESYGEIIPHLNDNLSNIGRLLNDPVGVDIALDFYDLKTFDNHVTSDNGKNINPNAVNLNNICGIGSDNYFKKYCGSTALLIYSLYDIPLPKTDA